MTVAFRSAAASTVRVVLLALLMGASASCLAAADSLPDRAIVEGHRLQPNAGQFGGTKSPSDVSRQEDAEIARLYHQLLGGGADADPPVAPATQRGAIASSSR